MKKLTKKILLVVLSTLSLFCLTMAIGCDCSGETQGGGGTLPSTPMVAEVTLNTTSANMIVGDYVTITAYTNKVPGLSLEFSSEDESIATINEFGIIEAVNKGSTNILVKYGSVTAKCAVTVNFDESLPEVIDLSALDRSYVLYKGDSLTFKPAIKYRGKIYYDGKFTFVSTDEEVVSFSGYTLTANDKVDVANCYVEASWRGFDVSTAQSLRQDFSVQVMTEAYISLKGTSEDFIELYTREEFDGKTYQNSSEFCPEFYAEGKKIEDVEFNYEFYNDSILDFNGGVVTAKSYGQSQIDISCTYEGTEYLKTINVDVLRPIADYEMELDNFSSGLGTFKDVDDNYVEKTLVEKIYGSDDATQLIEASQDGKTLQLEGNKILGVEAYNNASTHTVVTIGTQTEVYNVALNVYGLYIMTAEDLLYFTQKPEYRDYYYLACDIDADGLEMPVYGTKYYGDSRNGLIGTFEGNGHVISNLTTPSKGLFGCITGGTVQNVAFVDVSMAGYYPCLFGHTEVSTATIKNLYVDVKNVGEKGAVLFQQKLSTSATHENIVIVYDIAQEDVRGYFQYDTNSGNLSTYAPNRAVYYDEKVETFKNCFSISYAPVAMSQPKGSGYGWTSYAVAENQVTKVENSETGEIELVGNNDWVKEVMSEVNVRPVKKMKATNDNSTYEESGIDYIKGIKAYNTKEDMFADKEANASILATFDSTYWTVDEDGFPYWKSIYLGGVDLVVKEGDKQIDGSIVLTDDVTEITVDLVDIKGRVVDSTISPVGGLEIDGNKVKLADMPTGKGYYELVISTVINGMTVEKVVKINYSNEIKVDSKILYSKDDKSLDLYSLNQGIEIAGGTVITLADIEGYFVGDSIEMVEELELDVIISNDTAANRGRDRTVDVAQTVAIKVGTKSYLLQKVYAYTKVIDEATDLNYFIMDGVRDYNEVDGYFVLSKNIDASELELNAHVFTSGKIYPGDGYSIDVGFRGVFDGQGYTIDGLTTKTCGLFAAMNAPVVKDVAFTNVNLTGYYKTLFAKNYSRGKDYANAFTNYEGMFSNVYVSIKSIAITNGDKNVGIFVQSTLPASTSINNVIVEYLNVTEDVQAQIDTGKSFYMFGSSGFSVASTVGTYKNCYAISTAPVLSKASMPGFAENQVEYTLENNKVTAVGKVLDEQVTKILALHGKTLAVDHVLVGLCAYDNYEAMAQDTQNDYSSFATDYWTIVNGVPTWNTAYGV